MLRTLLLAAVAALGTAGCAVPTTGAGAASTEAVPVRGRVTDMNAFGAFIATRPTVDQFRTQYPDVVLVQPGEIATKEFRTDNSRYFARLDAEGRIVGGSFQ